jgi:hypothetical protein
MSSKMVAILILLVLSEVVGVGLGEWFYHLFLKAVPPVALSEFNSQSSRIAHWLYGAGVGLVLFAWSLIGMATNKIFHLTSKKPATT